MANENLKEKLSLTAQLNQIKQEALEFEKDSNELGRIGKDLANKANELAKQKRPILARNYKLAADDVKKQIAKNKLDEKNKKIREKALDAANGLANSLLTQIGLAGGLTAAFTKFNSLTRAVGENFGAIGMQTPAIKGGLLDASVEATGLGKSISDNIDIVNELTTSFGFGLEESINLSKSVLDTSVALGLSNTEGAKLIGTLSQVSGLSLEASDQFAKQTASLAKQEGVSPVAVLKDIAASSEDIAKFTDGTGENIAKAAIMATKLGTNLGTVAKVAEGLLDFESSITKELEASIMIGRQLNFQKARELALNNDIEGAMADVVSQLGSEEEFTRLNALQRKSLADSIGVGVDELAKFVNNQEKAKTLQDALVGQPFEDLVGDKAIDSISRIVNSFQQIGASLSVSIGPQVAGIAEGLANFVKFLGESKALIPGIVALMTIMAAKSLVTAYASLVTSGLLAGAFTNLENSLFGLFNTFVGGAFAQASLFSLGIMPYISSSIIIQLMGSVIPYFQRLQKEGEAGRKKITQITRYGTVLLATMQSYGVVAVFLPSLNSSSSVVVLNPGLLFTFTGIVSMVTGTLFLMWMGERITERGIGNGISLIIMIGIISAFPNVILTEITLVQENVR